MKIALILQIVSALLLGGVACTSKTKTQKKEDSRTVTSPEDLTKVDVNRTTTSGPPRLSSRELERLSSEAKQGNVDSMYTLSTYHFANSEVRLGYYWLGEAAKLGECHAILHLVENTFRGVTPEELLHWRNEEKRLGCDPARDDRVKPEIRINGVLQPAE